MRFLQGSPEPDGARPDLPGWKEIVVALVAALLLAAWPTRHALLDADQVAHAVDTATVQLPWSAHVPPELLEEGPGNSGLSDQGICFYPFYRWVSRSWRGGDPPTWCPYIYAGAPGFGNAQSGALDPQVLFAVGLEAVAGRRAFDWGLTVTSWLRIALALAGAYVLARRLGLKAAPAALAGMTFGFGGYLTLWLNHPLGHVTPALPWILFFLEGLRGRRPYLAAAGVATALALGIFAGHAETAFFGGATAGAWALAMGLKSRRIGLAGLGALGLGTLAGLVLLLPLIEYLDLSAATVVREAEAAHLIARPDLFALGVLLILLVLRKWYAGLLEPPGVEDPSPSRLTLTLALAGLALAAGGSFLFFTARGLQPTAGLALVPDLLGTPASPLGADYRGEDSYTEHGSTWVAFIALALAVAAALLPRGPLARRRLVLVLAFLLLLLAVRLPGLLEVWRLVPVAGLGDPIRLMSVASLLLGLLAGEALQVAPRSARLGALCVLVPLTVAVLFPRGETPLDPEVPVAAEADELLGFVALPAAHIDGVDSSFEGWLHPGVPAATARVLVEAIDHRGHPTGELPFPVPVDLYATPGRAGRGDAPEGARWFRTPHLRTSRLEAGHYRLTFELVAAGGETLTQRRAGAFTVERSVDRVPVTIVGIVVALVFLVLVPTGGSGFLAWCVVLLALGQGLFFSRSINPPTPRAAIFPETRTEAILAEGLGPHRFLSDPGVLPPDTGLVRGLSHIAGYDAMDVAAFNHYREHVLPPGVNALMAWNARGVDPANPAFRLYGVSMFAMAGPWEHPEWEFVAGPREEGDRWAETWIYRARDPYPRAFCVPRVVSLEELGEFIAADPTAWQPLDLAGINEEWRPAQPFTTAEVSVPAWTNATVRMTAELDGDGLLVLTDQAFPGWKVYVDGEEREILTANMIFRAVGLEAGRHTVEFRYEPLSIRLGAWVSILAGLGIVGLFAMGLLRRPREVH